MGAGALAPTDRTLKWHASLRITMVKTQASGHRNNWLILIGALKCLKGAILLLMGLGALKLLQWIPFSFSWL
jgi:hypothetical protein